MTMVQRVLVGGLVLAACACPAKPAAPTAESGTGSASPIGKPSGDACAAARPHVEQLYRAEAMIAESGRVDEAVADNTAMVMSDCAADPARVSACLNAATTVQAIEDQCLSRLDEAGNPRS